jgi:imidazolonepropionase-like amidohydrolase
MTLALIRDGVVLIDGDTIASIGNAPAPPEAATLDCSGCTITAGF